MQRCVQRSPRRCSCVLRRHLPHRRLLLRGRQHAWHPQSAEAQSSNACYCERRVLVFSIVPCFRQFFNKTQLSAQVYAWPIGRLSDIMCAFAVTGSTSKVVATLQMVFNSDCVFPPFLAGRERYYQTLWQGESYSQQTYLEHPWVVRTTDGVNSPRFPARAHSRLVRLAFAG